ncbi:hypothetical protein AAMO2058_000009700 [Amorphochlora amoebiformis]
MMAYAASFVFSLLFVGVWAGRGQLIDSDNFEDVVASSDHVWAVEFYSEMCGSCTAFSPVWDQVVQQVGTTLRTGRVNIDSAKGMQLAQDLEVLNGGLPAIRLFSSVEDETGRIILEGNDMMDGSVPGKELIISRIEKATVGMDKDPDNGDVLLKHGAMRII